MPLPVREAGRWPGCIVSRSAEWGSEFYEWHRLGGRHFWARPWNRGDGGIQWQSQQSLAVRPFAKGSPWT